MAQETRLVGVNAGQALWTRPKDQISDTEYNDFYKSACKQWDEPATRLHVQVEGTLSFTALLFVPGDRPFDLFDRDRRGLSLYVRRVFVMDECKDLLPDYLRFVRGVVDSDDLPLNVSREILQQQDAVPKLKKQLVKRILDHLAKLAAGDDAEKAAFAQIEAAFGTVLREGLDMPEVSLVAILDADKEGFLRSERSLIQTIGRAARHVDGKAILYGDNMTKSMEKAIFETERRRAIQHKHNEDNGITPYSIIKRQNNSILKFLDVSRRLKANELEEVYTHASEIPMENIPDIIVQMEAQMKESAKKLEFEKAAEFRDKIKHLRDKLLGRK